MQVFAKMFSAIGVSGKVTQFIPLYYISRKMFMVELTVGPFPSPLSPLPSTPLGLDWVESTIRPSATVTVVVVVVVINSFSLCQFFQLKLLITFTARQ